MDQVAWLDRPAFSLSSDWIRFFFNPPVTNSSESLASRRHSHFYLIAFVFFFLFFSFGRHDGYLVALDFYLDGFASIFFRFFFGVMRVVAVTRLGPCDGSGGFDGTAAGGLFIKADRRWRIADRPAVFIELMMIDGVCVCGSQKKKMREMDNDRPADRWLRWWMPVPPFWLRAPVGRNEK